MRKIIEEEILWGAKRASASRFVVFTEVRGRSFPEPLSKRAFFGSYSSKGLTFKYVVGLGDVVVVDVIATRYTTERC
jgi:hypothetical protein